MSAIVTHAPRFTNEEAKDLSRRLYGIQGEYRQLPSERDQNFHIRTESGKEYVLKIANQNEKRETLDVQNKAMMHVHHHKERFGPDMGVCPEIVQSRDGHIIEVAHSSDGRPHYVRLLTFLPGKPLGLVRPHDAALLKSLGRFLGHLDTVLLRFDHPAVHREFHWDVQHAPTVIDDLIDFIPDDQRKQLVTGYLKRYRINTRPKLSQIRQSVIHNDGNDYNVLVVPASRWRNRVDSIIDYGDMVFSHTINDVAVACAYVMMGKKDPLGAAKHIVAEIGRAHV